MQGFQIRKHKVDADANSEQSSSSKSRMKSEIKIRTFEGKNSMLDVKGIRFRRNLLHKRSLEVSRRFKNSLILSVTMSKSINTVIGKMPGIIVQQNAGKVDSLSLSLFLYNYPK